jgi:hypothetical protein
MPMRNRILGAIALIWGGAILVNALRGVGAQGSGAYSAGHTAGTIFGGLLFLVGGYYLLAGSGAKKS